MVKVMTKFPSFKRSATFLSCAALSLALVGCGSDDEKLQTKVTNDLGIFQGAKENGYVAFKGIRYAAAPEGELRFKAPTEAPSFEGTYDASEFGSACPQKGGTFGVSSENEDCLFLNVFTPNVKGEHPVMVWIHGGAFVTGAGSEYDPTKLVEEGITVVTINYRLGALGFLSHPELSAESGEGSGNYGLMDQQFALQWVQDNIESFGGNPDNVTIFGESAGGHSVTSQMVATGHEGLFHKAIIQSGNYHLEQLDPLSAETIGSYFPAAFNPNSDEDTGYTYELGCLSFESENLTCLRSKTVAEILEAQTADQYLPTAGEHSDTSIANGFLPVTAEDAIANGNIADVAIMNGVNLNEGTLFIALEQLEAFQEHLVANSADPSSPTLLEQLASLDASKEFLDEDTELTTSLSTLFAPFSNLMNGHSITDIKTEYLGDYDSNDEDRFYKAASKVQTDWRFACAASKTNDALIDAGRTVYAYHFTDEAAPNILAPFTPVFLGATHASEIQYIFNDGESGFTPEQEALSEVMIEYWSSFAKTGTPSGGSVAWSAFDGTASATVINLNQTLSLSTKESFDETHNCSFWND